MSIFTFIKNIFKEKDKFPKPEIQKPITIPCGQGTNNKLIDVTFEISTQNTHPRLNQSEKKLQERDANGRFKKKGTM